MLKSKTLVDSLDQCTWIEISHGVSMPQGAITKNSLALFDTDTCQLLAKLHRHFQPKRRALLAARQRRQARIDRGELPSYLDASPAREPWRVALIPPDLRQRRVEITGPVHHPKMVIQMLSSNDQGVRADCAMLDFEDSMKPLWQNVITGYRNVIGASAGCLVHEEPARPDRPARTYSLEPDEMAVVMVRVRGLHLSESNVRVDGEPLSAGLLDLAMCVHHAANLLMERGRTPKYYVPKVEHFEEARWWNELFETLEVEHNWPLSTLRATFLIETLSAAFQVEEILFELKDHAVGLNVGRWDKIFSDIKTLNHHSDRISADRAWIDMSRPWMKAYAERLIAVCHRHGAFALGGMAAFTPGRDAAMRTEQMNKVCADKAWERALGHDGCWVSHPFFIGPALAAFPSDHQLTYIPELETEFPDLLPQGNGPRTMGGLRTNVRVGIAYMDGWAHGLGCIAWDFLMEDLATLEISRAQVAQWLNHRVCLEDGMPVTKELVSRVFEEERDRILAERPGDEQTRWQKATQVAQSLFMEERVRPFLTEVSELATSEDGEGEQK